MSMINSINDRMRRKPGRTALFTLGTATVIAAVAYGAFFLLRDDSSAAAAQSASQIPFQVQRGNITTSISIGGTSTFLDKAELTFDAPGTLASVGVAAGDTVEEGDVIAQFDAATVARLRVAEAAAESALAEAQAVYDRTASGAITRSELATAEQAVALAELEVTSAQQSLFDVNAAEGADSAAVAAARTALSFAERERDNAATELADALTPDELSDQAEAVTDAEADYRDVLMRWLGAVPDGFETMPLDEILDAWSVSLSDIYTAYARQHLNSSTPWVDNSLTPWNEVVVWTWTSMGLNQVDTESLTSPHPLILAPRGEVEKAWTAVTNAREAYDSQVVSGDAAILVAEKAASKAEDTVTAAQDALADLLDPALVRARQAALDAAVAKRELAALSLAEEQAGSTADMNDAESRLELATQDLADAKLALENSVLVSPISGTVLTVNVEAGDEIQRGTVIAEIADTSVIAVEATVDEEDILSIQVGLPASVSLDAVASRAFAGTVTSIGQAEQTQQGAVSFPVVVTLDNTAGLNLVEGLTASAQVINSQVTDVLMVPVAAVTGSIFEPAVERMTYDGVESVPVQLGSSNGTFVEIVSGLQENDTVVATIAGQVGLPSGTGNTFIPGGGGTIVIPAGGFGGRIPGGGGFGGGGRGQ